MAIQIRRGTDAEWESNKSNIVAGEPAIAMDTERVFVGTGTGTYVELANIDFVEKAMKEVEYSNFELQSVKGDIVSFPNGAGGIPVKDLQVGIEAVQDLHGYDHPWVGGAGKNLFQDTGYHGAYGNVEAGTDLTAEVANANYTLQNDGAKFNFTASWQARLFATAPLTAGDYTISLDAESAMCRSALFVTDGDLKVVTHVKNYQSAGHYTPTTVTVTSGQRIAFTASASTSGSLLLSFQCEAGSSATTYERFENICPISGWTGANIVVSPTLDAQDGTTHPISWQTEAGTVYGGTLDVTTGVLTVTHGYVDLGTLTWTKQTNVSWNCFSATPVNKAYGIDNFINSNYEFGVIYGTTNDKIIRGNANNATIYIRDSDYMSGDASAFKTAMAGVQLVYELATPQAVQLTPTQVTTLLGQNNIWCDTGAIEELTYRISNVQ